MGKEFRFLKWFELVLFYGVWFVAILSLVAIYCAYNVISVWPLPFSEYIQPENMADLVSFSLVCMSLSLGVSFSRVMSPKRNGFLYATLMVLCVVVIFFWLKNLSNLGHSDAEILGDVLSVLFVFVIMSVVFAVRFFWIRFTTREERSHTRQIESRKGILGNKEVKQINDLR